MNRWCMLAGGLLGAAVALRPLAAAAPDDFSVLSQVRLSSLPDDEAAATMVSELSVGTVAFDRLTAADSPRPAPDPSILLADPTHISLTPVAQAPVPATSPAPLQVLGRIFDYTSADPATFQSSVLRLRAPTRRVQPFAAVAREQRYLEQSKLGFGGGTQWHLGRHASFGTEVLLFPDHIPEPETWTKLGDVRVLTRLQIQF